MAAEIWSVADLLRGDYKRPPVQRFATFSRNVDA
jgi:hypothetical protein